MGPALRIKDLLLRKRPRPRVECPGWPTQAQSHRRRLAQSPSVSLVAGNGAYGLSWCRPTLTQPNVGHQLTGNGVAYDVRGAARDATNQRVAMDALRRVLHRCALAAEDGHRLGRNVVHDLVREVLRHGHVQRLRVLTSYRRCRRLVHQAPGRLELHVHVSELVVDRLELDD